MTQWTSCNCEYCRPIPANTYLHAGAGDVWPANTEQARITRTMLAEAVEAARREGYDAGNEAGYECGYDHGYSQGTDDGFSDGVADGYDEGFEDGVAAGYDEGVNDGYSSATARFSLFRDDGYAPPEWIEGWGRV